MSSTSAMLEALVTPQNLATQYHFEIGTESCETVPDPCTPLPEGEPLSGSSPVAAKTKVEGLAPATVYHFRILADNGAAATGPDRLFATYATLFEGLPDGRAYEQASPTNKNGGDAVGQQALVKASVNGGAIAFGSDFGFPGGKGAQGFPTYLGSRGAGNWSSQGVLPPPSVGERDKIIGWLPDYSEAFTQAIRLGAPRTEALVGQSTVTQALVTIAPYRAGAEYAYVGASPDASSIFFEAKVALTPGAREGFQNVYVWNRASEEIHLVSVENNETEAAPPKGGFAGPYNWSFATNAIGLQLGGAALGSYLQEMRAITASGDIYFTASGTGQLYLRENPTQEQSPLNGQGQCEDEDLACTLQVSATHKENGQGPDGTDPAGPQPAAFQAASADGSQAFFISHEKLTNDANTGPEQPQAAIQRDTIDGNPAGIEKEFIPKHAVGVTVAGSHIYWADPSTGSIGRVDLDGKNADPAFIAPGEGECEFEPDPLLKPGVFKKIEIPSTPRYLAVDAGHIYWTNTGLTGELELPRDGGGTIGRANIDGTEIEPDFICGEEAAQPGKRLVSNPQGIAVDAGHIYWANAAEIATVNRSIARAAIDGSAVEQEFIHPSGGAAPYGVGVNGTDLYYDMEEEDNNFGYVLRVPLGGGPQELRFVGESGLRGLALDGSHVYWATQGEGGAIGRADLDLENKENKFIALEGAPNGLAADAAHLYWSVNGENSTNPGADLYRYQPGSGPGEETLEDLTVLAGGNGAEVQGVLGVSADGAYVYFAANGDFDGAGPASQGTCKGSVKFAKGKCNLYLWHEGAVSFIAPLTASGDSTGDALDWVGSPREVLNTGAYFPKTAFLGDGGRTLVFRSQEQLSAYENEGVREYYRYSAGDPEIRCLTCRPSGEAAEAGPGLDSIVYPGLQPEDSVMAVSARNLAADGDRFFFESAEALSPADVNGQGGCGFAGSENQGFPSCLDVYEWEAPGAAGGTCTETSPSYSPLNGGCVYLISTGKSKFPSLFADASASGNDVFFFTRQGLVGQDKDELQDVYDARVGGGLASQNPQPVVHCEAAESCHGPAQTPPAESSPATPTFVGPANPVPKHKKQNKKNKGKKHKGKGQKKQKKAKSNGRTAR